jgi:hypothetical protein
MVNIRIEEPPIVELTTMERELSVMAVFLVLQNRYDLAVAGVGEGDRYAGVQRTGDRLA